MQKQFEDHYYTLKEKSNGNIFSHNKTLNKMENVVCWKKKGNNDYKPAVLLCFGSLFLLNKPIR